MSVAGFVLEACSFIRLRSRPDFSATYGEMSPRSGCAAKADNHADISPVRLKSLSLTRPTAIDDFMTVPRSRPG